MLRCCRPSLGADAVKIDNGLWTIENSDIIVVLDKRRVNLDFDFVESAFKQLSPICSSPDELVKETARLSLHGHNWNLQAFHKDREVIVRRLGAN